jgi:hypothetical protein
MRYARQIARPILTDPGPIRCHWLIAPHDSALDFLDRVSVCVPAFIASHANHSDMIANAPPLYSVHTSTPLTCAKVVCKSLLRPSPTAYRNVANMEHGRQADVDPLYSAAPPCIQTDNSPDQGYGQGENQSRSRAA